MEEVKNEIEVENLESYVYVPPFCKDNKKPTKEEIQKAYEIIYMYSNDPLFCMLPIPYDKFPEEKKEKLETVEKEMNNYISNKLILDPHDLKQRVYYNFKSIK